MSEDDYEVGYGKPPIAGQFKPGQSGNPKGRPRGIKNLSTDLEEELKQKILITEGGQQHESTKQRAMLKTLFAKALKGDVRATKTIIDLTLGLENSRINADAVAPLDEQDQAILESFKARILAEHLSNNGE